MNLHPRFVYFGAAAAVFLADRWSKTAVASRLGAFDVYPVIPGFFDLIHAENRGAAFSLLADAPEPVRLALLVGAAAVAAVLIGRLLWRTDKVSRLTAAALALILGGAIGNIYDRALFGTVTDFLDVYIGQWHWPAFNVADAAITSGCIFLLLDSIPRRAAVTN